MFERTVYRIPAVQRKLGGVNENRAAYQLFVARFRPELEPQMGLHSTNHRICVLSQGFTKFYGFRPEMLRLSPPVAWHPRELRGFQSPSRSVVAENMKLTPGTRHVENDSNKAVSHTTRADVRRTSSPSSRYEMN